MANTVINSLPAIVTETDVAPVDSILTIDAPIFKQPQPREYVIIIKVITGTFQFAVGATPGVSNPSFTTTDDAFAVTVSNAQAGSLHFLAVAQNDQFQVNS